MSDEYDAALDRWEDALDAATDAILELLPGSDWDTVRDTIADAHTPDDPDWSFDVDRLVEALGEGSSACTLDALEAMFPVRP